MLASDSTNTMVLLELANEYFKVESYAEAIPAFVDKAQILGSIEKSTNSFCSDFIARINLNFQFR